MWTKHSSGNEVLEGKDFYISYAENPCLSISIFASDHGSSETALRANGRWYILNGDYRFEYTKAFPKGLSACLKVYKKNIKNRSSWSTDEVYLND